MVDERIPAEDPETREDRLRDALRAPPEPARRRPGVGARLLGLIPTLLALALLIGGGAWLIAAPDSPLAPEWNPTAPLDLSLPATPLTGFKLRRAEGTEASCHAALATGAAFEPLPPLSDGEAGCGIEWRVRLDRVRTAGLAPVETGCATALRLAAWQAYGADAAAEAELGAPIARLLHQGSYNCRSIRGGGRLSSHATADAIDIRGVVLADGRTSILIGNWQGEGPEARFWRAARDAGCTWFRAVLGPDFDANHADHLHLQATGRGTCR